MLELVDVLRLFHSLHYRHKGLNSSLFEVLAEHFGNESCHVESCKSDKLPAVAHLSQVRDEVFQIFFRKVVSIPVETW